uniref:Candidate secreted effector n=1 Tax=Meloidogyne incognita TaxID=6306 RepID=A0A914NBD7_MELIC
MCYLFVLLVALVCAVTLSACCCKNKRIPKKTMTSSKQYNDGVEVPDSDEDIFLQSKKTKFRIPVNKERPKFDDPDYKTWKGLDNIFTTTKVTEGKVKEVEKKAMSQKIEKQKFPENSKKEENTSSVYCSDTLVTAAEENLQINVPENDNKNEFPLISKQPSGVEITLPEDEELLILPEHNDDDDDYEDDDKERK